MEHLIPADRALIVSLGVGSGVLFVASLLLLPWLIARAPRDLFTRNVRVHRPLYLRVLRNVLAAALVLVGAAMLVLPGQGLLTILLGLLFADFPGKRRLLRAILRRDSVWRALSALRKRLGREPFERP
ncbi:MAG: hypothetical protein RL385_4321 [Pseudomonadota bacterium]